MDVKKSQRVPPFTFFGTVTLFNKPRTAKVGAISKAQNLKGDPSGFVKLQLVAKNLKKLKGGPFGDMKKFPQNFLMKGGPSGAIQKTSKKVLKKSGAKVCFRGCGRLFCFFFSFWTRF